MFFFFFNDTATTEIYTLSLHDALPISDARQGNQLRLRSASRMRAAASYSSLATACSSCSCNVASMPCRVRSDCSSEDRKSTRLNSSHSQISYAVFCLKQKNELIPPSSS